MAQLSGKTAIVTGASRGIGRAIAERFLAEGAFVLGVGRNHAPEDLAKNPEFEWISADLGNPADIADIFAYAQRNCQNVDILVNNAGAQLAASIEDTTNSDYDLLGDINMRAVFLCCQKVIPLMRRNNGGSIINLGSIAGNTPDYGLPLYSASKSWVHGFTKALAIEHGKDKIRCNALAPTWTRTELSIELFQEEQDPDFAERATNLRHPAGRMAEPDDIAQAAVFLAGPGSQFVSGQILSVDGALGAASQINPALDFQQ